MTIEEKLRLFILEKYCTMANFGEACGIAPTTLSAIFKRGIKNCSMSTLLKICNKLEISLDALANGIILPKSELKPLDYKDYEYIFDYMLVDDQKLSIFEKSNMKKMFANSIELIRESRKLLKDSLLLFNSGKGFLAFNPKTGERVGLNGNEIEMFRSQLEKDGVKPQDIVIMTNSEQGEKIYMEMMSNNLEIERDEK